MVRFEPITSLEIPDLQPYRTLRQPFEHFKKGLFVAEGEKVVQRLLETSIPLVSILLTPEWFQVYEPLLRQRSEALTAYCAPKALLERIVGYHLHQGIMALAQIPKALKLEDLIQQSEQPHLFVALDGLTNAENVGVIVRNCAAFGVHGIIVGETSSSPYLRRAVRNSMGAIFKIPIFHSQNLVETLTTLNTTYSCTLVAAHPHTSTFLTETPFERNICLIFGSEGEGISSRVLSICNIYAAIPMANNVDSLNVASASAVFLYEVARQRSYKNFSDIV
ncbi:MAG: RNA methyltransferase [Bacteroidetes bacterium]|nr:RNA methyltransferase [Bacteroidota bacterium]